MEITKLLAKILIFLFWPLAFLLENGQIQFFNFFFPSLFLSIVYLIFWKGKKIWWVGFFITLAVCVIFIFGGKNFKDNSIFYHSRDDEQYVLREGYLYPTVWMSRLFQNKPSIYLDRFKSNFFALSDPNNYFFGFHPREIEGENQNLQKFPSLAILFFLFGLYFLPSDRRWRFIALSLFSLVVLLSFLRNFDRYDLILFIPLSLLIVYGLDKFLVGKNKLKMVFVVFFIIFSLIEYAQLIISLSLNR